MGGGTLAAAPRAQPSERRGGARPRVLVIEDDNGVVEVVERTLGNDDFDLTFVATGQRGLDLAATGEYDLVLLDLLLPDIDGASLLRRLMAARPGQQVLVMSALSNVEAKVRCLDLGAADYLPKPFALQELVARVRARLRAPQPHVRYVLSETVKLDVQRRVAIVDSRTVPLSQREFALLEHLVRHQGEVCTRKDLLEFVWGYTFDPGTNVVDVYVRRLRKKLGDVPIETVRNVGYALAAG